MISPECYLCIVSGSLLGSELAKFLFFGSIVFFSLYFLEFSPTCFRGDFCGVLASSRKPISHGLSPPGHFSLGLVVSRQPWARPLVGGNIITPPLCPSRPRGMPAVAHRRHASPFPVGLEAPAISNRRANSFYGTSWHYLYFPH